MASPAARPLGPHVRDRRTRLDPAASGFTGGRRRTPGSRRQDVASRAIGSVRTTVARARVDSAAAATRLVGDPSRTGPEFEASRQGDDGVAHRQGVKRVHRPDADLSEADFSSAAEGRPQLGMIVYDPASAADAERRRALVAAKGA